MHLNSGTHSALIDASVLSLSHRLMHADPEGNVH